MVSVWVSAWLSRGAIQTERETKGWETATQSACLTCSPMWERAKQERELLYVSVSQNPVGLLERLTCLCCGQPTWVDGEGSAKLDHSVSCRYLSLSVAVWLCAALFVCLLACSSLCCPLLPSSTFSHHSFQYCYRFSWLNPGCEGMQLGWGGTDRRCWLCFPQDRAPSPEHKQGLKSLLHHTQNLRISMRHHPQVCV